MNAKRMLFLAAALMLIFSIALGEVSPVEDWVKRYNECAGTVKAYAIDTNMISDLAEYGYCGFTLSEYAYLDLYMNENSKPQGILFETFAGDALAKGTFLSALCASDEAIALESAADAFDKAANAYEDGADGKYAYCALGRWVLVFSKEYGDGQLELFSAFTVEAYERMYGEDAPEEDADALEEDDDPQPDEDSGEPSQGNTSPEPEKKGKIHKL